MAKELSFVVSDPVGLHARPAIVAEGDDEEDVVASIAKVIKEQKVAE